MQKLNSQLAWTPIKNYKVLVYQPPHRAYFQLIAGDEENPTTPTLCRLAGEAVGVCLHHDTVEHFYTWQEGRKVVICHSAEYFGSFDELVRHAWFGYEDLIKLLPAHRPVLCTFKKLWLVH